MTRAGSVSGLGKASGSNSVRFIGALGYVVTFRQVDPLYTLDLRDPAIRAWPANSNSPGYSAYLSPAGDGKLIGVGQEANAQGRTTGLQVALFDASRTRRIPRGWRSWSRTTLTQRRMGSARLPLLAGHRHACCRSTRGTVANTRVALVLTVTGTKITVQGTINPPAGRSAGSRQPGDSSSGMTCGRCRTRACRSANATTLATRVVDIALITAEQVGGAVEHRDDIASDGRRSDGRCGRRGRWRWSSPTAMRSPDVIGLPADPARCASRRPIESRLVRAAAGGMVRLTVQGARRPRLVVSTRWTRSPSPRAPTMPRTGPSTGNTAARACGPTSQSDPRPCATASRRTDCPGSQGPSQLALRAEQSPNPVPGFAFGHNRWVKNTTEATPAALHRLEDGISGRDADRERLLEQHVAAAATTWGAECGLDVRGTAKATASTVSSIASRSSNGVAS